MKAVRIDATIPGLKGKVWFTAEGFGNSWPLALYRAAKILSKYPKVKGKHVSFMSFNVLISNVSPENEETWNKTEPQESTSP